MWVKVRMVVPQSLKQAVDFVDINRCSVYFGRAARARGHLDSASIPCTVTVCFELEAVDTGVKTVFYPEFCNTPGAVVIHG